MDDPRYLPFEGTGAVSAWRLELTGRKNPNLMARLRDVAIDLKYTADQGGSTFANAVKGMLKPYPTAVLFSVAEDFPEEWEMFMKEEGNELTLPLTRDLFPNISGNKIASVLARYEMVKQGGLNMLLMCGNQTLTLRDSQLLLINNFSINSQGFKLKLIVQGERRNVKYIYLIAEA